MAIKKIFKKDNENNFYGLDFKDCYLTMQPVLFPVPITGLKDPVDKQPHTNLYS